MPETPTSSGRVLTPCTGAYDCPAGQHIHGCHNDFGSCDNPAEHWPAASDSGAPDA